MTNPSPTPWPALPPALTPSSLLHAFLSSLLGLCHGLGLVASSEGPLGRNPAALQSWQVGLLFALTEQQPRATMWPSSLGIQAP